METKNRKLLIAGLLVALGMLYLIYAATKGATVYYLTVEEFLAQQGQLADEGVRIAGIVTNGSIRRNAASSDVTFTVQGTSGNAVLPVHYKGVVSDMFRDGASIILEGKYNRASHIFQAVMLMTSCPSEYESKLKNTKP